MKSTAKKQRPTASDQDGAVTDQLQRFRQQIETLGEKFLKLLADYDDVLCYMNDELQIYNDDIGLYSDAHKSSKLILGLLALEGLGPLHSSGNQLHALPRLLGLAPRSSRWILNELDAEVPF